MLVALAACSAYDASLLDGVGGSSSAGAGGTGGANGSDAGAPVADGKTCGDGLVGANEKCDTMIAAGLPGSCPTRDDCLASICPPRDLLGLGCQAECVDEPIGCGASDGCCGRSCTPLNDPDCSTECGDGVVDVALGETCEPGSVNDCPMNCDDDDPCTQDLTSGDRDNCNLVCEHRPIVRLAAGDDCCPPDGTPGNDADCAP